MIISLPGAAALLSKKIKNKTNNVFEEGEPRKALNENHSLVSIMPNNLIHSILEWQTDFNRVKSAFLAKPSAALRAVNWVSRAI